ncbi:hypothetical protein CIHG_05332 [Coccidioides immitis H538.4]|uniref:Uncharacterized protein n=3 Tax=Coccidioides immitis TaxID=5501 RepID=A0A0J8R606_COCIT|nr:hypothetical protein CIRG_02112 [Coccidioides immitis RMSCC 2394]KMU79875.1 hypothetical protein CISG_07948 [Coccidioides immitis RMSCC 3703]KMU88161.1 hypothetical protein CIHG_05332 [Coccidioides immitis H538.4]
MAQYPRELKTRKGNSACRQGLCCEYDLYYYMDLEGDVAPMPASPGPRGYFSLIIQWRTPHHLHPSLSRGDDRESEDGNREDTGRLSVSPAKIPILDSGTVAAELPEWRAIRVNRQLKRKKAASEWEKKSKNDKGRSVAC